MGAEGVNSVGLVVAFGLVQDGVVHPAHVTGAVALCVASVLLVFTVRRLVLLAAALSPPRQTGGPLGSLPSVVLVVAARNEVHGIDRTLGAIERLTYPPERLFVVLVNDCSDDRTGERLAAWAARRSRVTVIDLPARLGKPQAVDRGIATAPPADLVAVFDADVRPRPDYLLRVAEVFADPTVGGAAGFLAPANPRASTIARYAALESWVHQLVTSAGKDRLDLNPPTLGGAAVYRHVALQGIGGLGPAPSGDDVLATVALTRAGWRTRFVRDAIADNEVVSSWAHYRRQHVRWARDLFATARRPTRSDVPVPLARRIERWMLSAGYVDRIALLTALGLVAYGELSPLLVLAYLAVPAGEIGVALRMAGVARELPAFMLAAIVVFTLDVATTVGATAAHVLGRPRAAQSPERTWTGAAPD